jgi:hypothetical protein
MRFSKPNKHLISFFKKESRSYAKHDIKGITGKYWADTIERLKMEGLCEVNAKMDILIRYGHSKNSWHNIYIDSYNVYDFMSTNKIKKHDAAKAFDILAYQYGRRAGFNGGGIYIHMPNENHSIYFVCAKLKLKDNEHVLVMVYGKNYEHGVFILDEFLLQEKQRDLSIEETLIFNALLYMDAFPECVHSGAPNVIINGGTRSSTIMESEAIKKTYADRSLTSHFRRGHFRFLQSDRYKGKRFQTIYVRPTMVKGMAETVTYEGE